MWLKQCTSVVIQFGPFLDKTDGVTLETGLASALDDGTTGIFLSKNGGTLTIRHATVTASSYDAHGCYKATLDTTDTGTLGSLRVIYTDATTCLPVWVDFQVLPANIYDSLVLGSDVLDISAIQLNGTSIAGTGSRVADAFVVFFNVASSVLTTASINQTGDSFARIGATGSGLTTLLAAASYTAPDNAGIAAIKIQTDKLTFTVATQVDCNVQSVNDVQVKGTGTANDPWNPV